MDIRRPSFSKRGVYAILLVILLLISFLFPKIISEQVMNLSDTHSKVIDEHQIVDVVATDGGILALSHPVDNPRVATIHSLSKLLQTETTRELETFDPVSEYRLHTGITSARGSHVVVAQGFNLRGEIRYQTFGTGNSMPITFDVYNLTDGDHISIQYDATQANGFNDSYSSYCRQESRTIIERDIDLPADSFCTTLNLISNPILKNTRIFFLDYLEIRSYLGNRSTEIKVVSKDITTNVTETVSIDNTLDLGLINHSSEINFSRFPSEMVAKTSLDHYYRYKDILQFQNIVLGSLLEVDFRFRHNSTITQWELSQNLEDSPLFLRSTTQYQCLNYCYDDILERTSTYRIDAYDNTTGHYLGIEHLSANYSMSIENSAVPPYHQVTSSNNELLLGLNYNPTAQTNNDASLRVIQFPSGDSRNSLRYDDIKLSKWKNANIVSIFSLESILGYAVNYETEDGDFGTKLSLLSDTLIRLSRTPYVVSGVSFVLLSLIPVFLSYLRNRGNDNIETDLYPSNNNT